MRFLIKYWFLCFTIIITSAIFYPSLFVFFTNDDFFFLKISKVDKFLGIFNFFNITHGPEGFGVYRPLTTQLFYMLENPILMHVIVLLTFFYLILLIYKLAVTIFKNHNLSLISVYLYSVSATHFAHFYYLATFQELGMTVFVLLSILNKLKKKYIFSLFFFVLALMSKETAVVTPFLILLVDWYKKIKIDYKKFLGYISILFVYLYFHFYVYGIATGDTYVWVFEIKKLINSLVWYLIWSLNLPETLIDYIGPGLTVNQNLFKYWANIIYPIFILAIFQIAFIAYFMIKKMKDLENKRNSLFVILWFCISLLPVIFLPYHKFSFYLTLPLVSIVYRIGYLIVTNKFNMKLTFIFLVIWTSLSVLTIKHSVNTSWITQGQKVAIRVNGYFKNLDKGVLNSYVFKDTELDKSLPWSPTEVLKTTLSNKNFFAVYFPGLEDRINYGEGEGETINSRQFLGY